MFTRDYPETVTGVVAHAGTETRRLADDIVALPWTTLAGATSPTGASAAT